MCPLCPCSGTTAQYGGGGGACVLYVPVVVLQHSMEEDRGACVPYLPVVELQHSLEEEEHVSPMSL